MDVGVAPVPPPSTTPLRVRAADDASVVEPVKPSTPPDVPEVMPVPPFPTGSVPLTSVVRTTGPYVGAPLALPWSTVVAVPAAPWTMADPSEIIMLLPLRAVPLLVPPLAMGSTPVTSVVSEIPDHDHWELPSL